MNPNAPIRPVHLRGDADCRTVRRAGSGHGLPSRPRDGTAAPRRSHRVVCVPRHAPFRSRPPGRRFSRRWWTLYGADMLRYKGVLDVAGRDERAVFQGVQTLIEVAWGAPWQHDESRTSALVFIGRDLPRALIERGLEQCLVPVARAIHAATAARRRSDVMAAFDLTIRNGTLVTATETSRGDLGIAGGRIVAVAEIASGGRARHRRVGPPGHAGRHRQPLPRRAALRHGHDVRRRLLLRRRFPRRSAARRPSCRSRASIAATRCSTSSPTTTSARARRR